MKRIICFICVLVLSCIGSIEAYAGYSVDRFTEDSTDIFGERDSVNIVDIEDRGNIVSGDDGKQEPKVRVLIVGNSFSKTVSSANATYSIEQPLMELAAGEGHNLEAVTLAHDSARLCYYAGMKENYYSYYRELIALLMDEKWDYIIFQEQTAGAIEYFDSQTVPAIEKLQQMVKAFQPQATMLLYMNAAYSDGEPIKVNNTPRLLSIGEMELYLAIAFRKLQNQLGIEAVMVGMHSYRINLLYPQINILRSDNKHPTHTGYYLAACCFYHRIYGKAPDPLKASLRRPKLSKEELVAISALSADSIVLNKDSIVIKEGKTAQLKTTVSSHLAQSYAVSYHSFDKSVASVDSQTGVVTAGKAGNTIIYAQTPDGLQAFCDVTVRSPLSFSRDYYLAGKGDKLQIIPQTNQDKLKWYSSKKSVATVNASTGLVTVKSSGRAIITVVNKDDSKDKASYTLYVPYDAPENVKAISTGNPAEGSEYGNIKVSWRAVDGASRYEVYRSTSKNGKYELIGSSRRTSYTDKNAAVNNYYYYKVVAKNSYQYCASPLSSSSARGIILKAPTLKVQRTKSRYAKLTWKANSKATGYIIYRSKKRNSGYKAIAKITFKWKTSFIDKNVKKKGKKSSSYYYRIKAYRILDDKVFYGVNSLKVKL